MQPLEKHPNSILRKKKKRRKEVKKMRGMGMKKESKKSKKMRILTMMLNLRIDQTAGRDSSVSIAYLMVALGDR